MRAHATPWFAVAALRGAIATRVALVRSDGGASAVEATLASYARRENLTYAACGSWRKGAAAARFEGREHAATPRRAESVADNLICPDHFGTPSAAAADVSGRFPTS